MRPLIIAAVFLFSAQAFAQAALPAPPAAPATIAPYDLGLTLPALKFPWGGGTPVEVAGGAGFQLEANLFPITLPNLGLVPLLSVGGLVQGSLSPAPAATSYNLSIGPEVTICHVLGVGIIVDLVASGPNGITGLLPGRFGLPNVAGILFYNVQSLIDAL